MTLKNPAQGEAVSCQRKCAWTTLPSCLAPVNEVGTGTSMAAVHPRVAVVTASPRAPCLGASAKDGAQRSARPTVNLWMHPHGFEEWKID